MEKLGKYQILGPVGTGSNPALKAKGPDGVIVALKTLPTEKLSAELRERFVREAQIGAQLDHPNLVKILDSGEADGYLYQAMELLDGKDLGRVFVEAQPLPWDLKISLMEQVCDALAYAHARYLVHRDIKPENIFVERSGRVRILDFGMVKVSNSDLTQAGLAVGTLNFMAPEQVMSQPVSAATDIFAAGAVFYQFATGVHPFSSKNKSLPEILTAIMSQDPLPLSVTAPDAPAGLNDVLQKALRKNPRERWQDASLFKAALAACRNARPAPVEEVDPTKTRVMSKDIIAELKKRPVVPAAPPAEKALPDMHRRFCPQCTHANSVNAVQCARCGAPLVNTPEGGPEEGGKKNSLPLYLVIGLLAGLMILLLILVLVLARRE